MREATNSLNENIEASLDAFDMPKNYKKIYYIYFLYASVDATIQIVHDVSLCDRFCKEDEIFRDFITLKRRRGKGLKTHEYY